LKDLFISNAPKTSRDIFDSNIAPAHIKQGEKECTARDAKEHEHGAWANEKKRAVEWRGPSPPNIFRPNILKNI
jgi:hypothetical protein